MKIIAGADFLKFENLEDEDLEEIELDVRDHFTSISMISVSGIDKVLSVKM